MTFSGNEKLTNANMKLFLWKKGVLKKVIKNMYKNVLSILSRKVIWDT